MPRHSFRKVPLTVTGKVRQVKVKTDTKWKRRYSTPGRDGLQSSMFWMMHDPLIALKNREGKRNNGRTRGHVFGIRKKTFLRYQTDADRDARKIVKHMVDKKIWTPDNDISAEAMKELVTVLRHKGLTAKEKILAAKTVLEFTQRKPVQESDVNINTAEQFLEGILVDVKKERDLMTPGERWQRIEYTKSEPVAGPQDIEGQLRDLCEARPEDQDEGK
jgi:hypothetical protein